MDKNKSDFDLKKVTIGRSLEGTIMEAITVTLLIAAWTIAFVKHEFSGSIETWPWLTIFSTIVCIAILLSVYQRPYSRLDYYELTNARVIILSIRRSRVGAIVWALLVLCHEIWDFSRFPNAAYWLIPIAIFLIPELIFEHFIRKAKKE